MSWFSVNFNKQKIINKLLKHIWIRIKENQDFVFAYFYVSDLSRNCEQLVNMFLIQNYTFQNNEHSKPILRCNKITIPRSTSFLKEDTNIEGENQWLTSSSDREFRRWMGRRHYISVGSKHPEPIDMARWALGKNDFRFKWRAEVYYSHLYHTILVLFLEVKVETFID